MTAPEIKNLITAFTNDVVFDYNGKTVCINPFNDQKFEVGIGNATVHTFHDIDELMSAPVFNGRSLADIAPQISI